VPGAEFAGVVEAVGEGVTHLKPGDAVAALAGTGGFATHACVDASRVLPLPPGFALEDGAALAFTYGTSHHALIDRGQLKDGETVLVLGAAGGVGTAALQIAKAAGARVIAAASSDEKCALCRQLGADEVICAAQEHVVEAVKRHTEQQGVDIIFELVGRRETMDNSLQCLRKRGRLVFIGYSEDQLVANPLLLVIGEVQILASVGSTQQDLIDAVALASAGKLRQIIDRTAPLSDVNAMLQALQRGEIAGRAVLTPGR